MPYGVLASIRLLGRQPMLGLDREPSEPLHRYAAQ